MHTPTQRLNPNVPVHPLYRIAMEAPEQLEPGLRRIVFKMVRRRLAAWLKASATAAMSNLEDLLRKRRTS